MYRPSFTAKLRINYAKTWAKLNRLFDNPAPIRPAPAPEHLAEHLAPKLAAGLPQLKGNVAHTMNQIVAIFMKQWQEAKRPLNLAIQTTRASLAKRCKNRDPKTAYRHILTLIEHGFLRAKVHVRGGLQLLLNPDLIVFDAAPAAVAAAGQGTPAPAAAPPALGSQRGLGLLLGLAEKFTVHTRRPT